MERGREGEEGREKEGEEGREEEGEEGTEREVSDKDPMWFAVSSVHNTHTCIVHVYIKLSIEAVVISLRFPSFTLLVLFLSFAP